MPTCTVPGCTSGYPSNSEKVHFFTVPANPSIQKLWKDAIRHANVKTGRAVCEKHFKKNEILWQRQFMSPTGQVVGVGQYKIPRLVKGSVPSLFPWTEKAKPENEFPRETQNEQQSQFNEENVAVVESIAQEKPLQEKHKHSSSCKEQFTNVPPTTVARQSPIINNGASAIPVAEKRSCERPLNVESIATRTLTFEDLLTAELCLPAGWIKYSTGCKGKRLIMFYTNKTVQVQETYNIFPLKNVMVMENLTIQLKVVGFVHEKSELTMPLRVTSTEELQDLLLRIHRFNVCRGITISTTFELNEKYSTLRKDASDVWRHADCPLLLFNKKVCTHCTKAKDTVSRFQRRLLKGEVSVRKKKCLGMIEQKRELSLLHTKYRSALRAKRLTKEKLKMLNSEVVEIRNRLRKCSNKDLEQHVMDGNIPQNYLHVVDQIMETVKHKNSKGKNYSEQWMLLCMLLHIRSPSGYDFLRRNNILPLPCMRTIRRYLSKIKTTCGFDPQFFQVLKETLNEKRESERHGILLLDEIVARESVPANTKEMAYKELIDFGSETGTLPTSFDKANRGLVLMFQSLDADYCQPIAVFASKGPVKGGVLAQLIIKAIILLEKIGAKIHGVVSDGASPIRKFWPELGVCGLKKNLCNYFDHPVDEHRKVYVFSNAPHLLKTIRNRLYNNGVLQLHPSEEPIKWEFIQLLYTKDQETAGPEQALVCPKLTADHVYLNNSLKMHLGLAIQVFSNSVSTGLLFFEKNVAEMEGCRATASFCKWLNDLFDALNRSNASDGVQPGDLDFDEIQESLRKLDAWEKQVQKGNLGQELFLTQQTAEGLRVTLKSTLDLVEYLTGQCGFSYVLTSRVNRNPLEVCSRGSTPAKVPVTRCSFLQS